MRSLFNVFNNLLTWYFVTPLSSVLRWVNTDFIRVLGSIVGLSMDRSLLRVSECIVSDILSCFGSMPSIS